MPLSFGGGPTKFIGSNIYSYFLILLLFFALYLAYEVVEPFLNTLIFSTVLAVIFYPLFRKIETLLDGRTAIAAILTVVIIAFAFVLPACIFIFGLIDQGVQNIASIAIWLAQLDLDKIFDSGGFDKYILWLKLKLPFLPIEQMDLQEKVMGYSRNFMQSLIAFSTYLVRNGAGLVLQFLLMMFVLFYFLKDGREMVERIKFLSPLRNDQENAIMDNLMKVARSVLVGSMFIALLQGVAGGIGLVIVGLPALFWGTMMGFASLVPVAGTGLIWIPAVLYLVIIGQWQWAIFLTLWCGLVVVSIDTFLRPVLMREASGVSTFYILLAILGGINAFGPMGILYGPLVLSFVMVMLQLYSEEYREFLVENEWKNL
ncbi:MAG: AI-2E family transporter [Desulfovibrio sp.]